jgi:hypothetical protein
MITEVLDWPELTIRPELRADYCRPRKVKPIPASWHWMAFSFHVHSLIELRGVSVLIPDRFSDEFETAQYLLYRAIEARLFTLKELERLRKVSGWSIDSLLFNVFTLLEVSMLDRDNIVRRICHLD